MLHYCISRRSPRRPGSARQPRAVGHSRTSTAPSPTTRPRPRESLD